MPWDGVGRIPGDGGSVADTAVWVPKDGVGGSGWRIHGAGCRGEVAVVLASRRAQRMEQWGCQGKAVVDPQGGSMWLLVWKNRGGSRS